MYTQITITPAQLASGFVALCVSFAAIAKAIGYITDFIHQLRRPEENQNQRLHELEAELERHKEYLASDKKRLDAIEEGNRASMRALLAILSHSIDGNEIDALKSAKKEIHDFLIKK